VARGEFVLHEIWEELGDVSANAMLLYLWSFTNARCNMAGLYRVSERSMLESKVSRRALPGALEELRRGGFLFYEDGVMWVRARAKRIHTHHPNMAKSIARDVDQLSADHPLRARFLEHYRDHPWLRPALSGFPLHKRDAGDSTDTLVRVPTAVQCSEEKEEQPTAQGEVDAEPELPDELRPFLEPVLVTLRRVAATKPGATLPILAAVAGVLRRYPTKDFIPTAEDYAHWSIHGRGASRSVKDVVAQYRNWLAKEPDVARRTPSSNGQLTDPTEDRLRRATA
jgi:hypothetical protein